MYMFQLFLGVIICPVRPNKACLFSSVRGWRRKKRYSTSTQTHTRSDGEIFSAKKSLGKNFKIFYKN